MRRSLLLLAALVLSPAHAAEPRVEREVVFRTRPSGAEVVLHKGPVAVVVGRSGEPLRLVLPPTVTTLHVTFRLDGHLDRQVSLPVEGDLPEVVLQPASAWVAVRDRAGLLAWVGGGALGILFGVVLPWRRRVHRTLARARRLETFHEPDEPFVGKKLGSWRLARRLGSGGMATVYEAVPDETLDDREAVAIKVLHPETAADPEFRARFQREIRTCRAMTHPSIVRLIDWGEQDDALYLVMERLRGRTLGEVSAGSALPAAEVARLLRPVFEALSYAHARGVVHRDLKPDNVMVLDDGRVKVMDFGIARRVDNRITSASEVVGTAGYMAPEQIRGLELDARSDQYAVGVIAFELLTGHLPAAGDDTAAVLYCHMSEEPLPDVRTVRPDVPEALAAVVARLLAKDAGARFACVEEALEAFERADENF